MTAKNCASCGACVDMKLTKLTICPSRPIRLVARLIKATISPTVVRPRISSQTPTISIASSERVELARVATLAIPHHVKTGSCAASSRSPRARSPRGSSSIRPKLWITGRLPSTSETRSASSVLSSPASSCLVSVRRTTVFIATANIITRTIRIAPSRQFTDSVIGNSTNSATKPAQATRLRCARRSACSETVTPAKIENSPKPVQSASQGRSANPLRNCSRALRAGEPIDDLAEQQGLGE